MSVCVKIRTKSTPNPKAIFEGLVKTGEQIVATSNEYPCLKLGNHLKALRGIEINEEENGVEVRVCSFASTEDYRLFAKTIATLQKLTGGTAYEEDDDDTPIANPLERFDDTWIETQRETDFCMNNFITKHYGTPIIMDGIFMNICLGAKLFSSFDLNASCEYDKEKMNKLQEYLCSLQWFFANKTDTSTRLAIPDPKNPDSKPLSLSMICIKDGKVNKFDYVSHADLLGIIDMDDPNSNPVLIPFNEAWKVLPNDEFRLIDELQFERTTELTIDSVHNMMMRARKYQPEDIHHHFLAPGYGYDKEQNTFILMWNPAFSSITLQDHKNSIKNIATEYFNWSIREYDKAKIGDRFYLVRVGQGNTGIVMSGVFDSAPYENEDWSGKKRRTFYIDMIPNVIIDSDNAPYISTSQLEEIIPTFEWARGSSGRLLPAEDAKKLELMWANFLKQHTEKADGVNMSIVGHID